MLLEYLQQPIVHAGTGEIAGVELLARFDGQPPAGILGDRASGWLALDLGGLSHIRDGDLRGRQGAVFVNLSRHVVRYEWATDTFLQVCRRAQDQCLTRIVVEIDEETDLPDPGMSALAQRVRATGLLCAMDDHRGSPFCYRRSDLGCWDFIKVCSRNRPIESACKDIQILAATGVPVVAEAIETQSARIAAESAGASYIQGWHTGYPEPVWTDSIADAFLTEGDLSRQISGMISRNLAQVWAG
ncbi:MAG: hypothetical protein A2286_06045 [Gammaproteobacteria bacterium RIFOXYA12_FULL_61_12]|nr:MAG: hypothetical protein A2514_15945 [Gammaproteobacteria bacterium RIFOXYD12_FULL_61_37]OGT94576.1 MAG: hypothetical protein A2286_06045 [Gammaproteobacteria bacterium RIFOXYA12_FULL_61_12]